MHSVFYIYFACCVALVNSICRKTNKSSGLVEAESSSVGSSTKTAVVATHGPNAVLRCNRIIDLTRIQKGRS